MKNFIRSSVVQEENDKQNLFLHDHSTDVKMSQKSLCIFSINLKSDKKLFY